MRLGRTVIHPMTALPLDAVSVSWVTTEVNGPGKLPTGGSHGRHHARKTPQDCPGCSRRNLLHHLPTQPYLAFWMAVARRPWPILFPDDLRGLRGSRCLSDCRGAQSF